MEKLTDIAKDYLADFDVLTDARKEFESQLDAWWRVLFDKHLKPAIIEASQSKPHIWDNQNSSGMCQCRAHYPQDVLLEVTDPRVSSRGFYTVALFVASLPALKKLSRQPAIVKRMDDLAARLNVCGQSGLKWNGTELAREEIPILPDSPEETIGQVREAAVRFFRLVMEHHRAISEEKAA